ncbi:hypothetical protein B5E92_10960 [Erysipelatoclostridium sp. An15]|uniref:hypothetical protein n=1 Tax=Erysipelatoclostridium sp. An15 TaxID=1965566 RepID=UPI000B3A5DFE|nr:hypothetical protein [Erysipelatoclostridium sp. An15]OUQ06793.1 hypothetical protein B5E92_10960 [Erysipelatoclostridium sp. An15]
MNNSRVNKYRELREGIKEEVGINREGTDDNVNNSNSVDEDDDFLLSVNRAFRSERKEPDIEDTLTEAKTFEQMQRESSEEIDRALRSAKVSVGKAAHYNTRMDILNKIREPEKQVVRLNKFDNVSTSQFSKGFFVNGDDEELIDEISDKAEKKKMTLMERLASMSPEEDAKKAKLIMEEENVFEDEEENEELDEVTEPVLEQTKSLEEMLKQIKEKDQREVEKVLKQKEMTTSQRIIKEETVETDLDEESEEIEENNNDKGDRVATILNYIIIFLVIVFVGLCGMIGYQIFF